MIFKITFLIKPLNLKFGNVQWRNFNIWKVEMYFID